MMNWYRGKVREVYDEDEAEEWIKEIDMAKEETPKRPVARKPEAPVEVPAVSGCGCELEVGENNTGGFNVSHPSRLGSWVTGTFRPGEDTQPWIERIHAEECDAAG